MSASTVGGLLAVLAGIPTVLLPTVVGLAAADDGDDEMSEHAPGRE